MRRAYDYNFYGVKGFISHIDSRNPSNILSGTECILARDKSGNGHDWTKIGSNTGMFTISSTVQYPDVAANTMVSLPSVTAFNCQPSTARMIRATNLMNGLTEWTIVSVRKTASWDTTNDKFAYRLDNGGLQVNGGTGAGYFYNGTTYGTNSAGLGVSFDVVGGMWQVCIHSYSPPVGTKTSRHWVMQNGLVSVVNANIAGALEADPASENFGWPTAANEYLPRADYQHISLGTTNPVSLTTGSNQFSHQTIIMAVAPRAISFDEAGLITQRILSDVYAGAPAGFMRTINVIGDSLHAEGGSTSSTHGFYWADLPAVRKASVIYYFTPEGGNTIEVQTARTRANVGRMQKTTHHGPVVLDVMIGTNNPTDDENAKWTKVKTLLDYAKATGAPTHINVGELLACGTVGSVTTADASRCAAHDAYNVVMRAGMSSGGDFFTANPAITCGILRYATSVPKSYEVPVQVLNPASGAPGFGTLVGTTTPSDVTNAAQNHYGDFLHPRSTQTRPNGTQPIYARLGMFDTAARALDIALWPLDGANNFISSSNQIFKGASNTDLTGDINFSMAFWVNMNVLGTKRVLISKLDWGTVSEVWEIRINADNTFEFRVSSTGTGAGEVGVVGNVTPVAGNWYFIRAWHDSTANEIGIQINNGVKTTTSHALGMWSVSVPLTFGAELQNGNPVNGHNGILDSVGLWTKVISDGEAATLWNNGYGVTSAGVTGGLLTNLYDFFNLNGSTGAEVGAINSTSLTASASRPTLVTGFV